MRSRTRKSTIVAAALATLVAAWASACMPKIQRPEVHLAGIRLGGLGLQGGSLYVRLSIVNPNSFALRASGLSYRVELREPGEDGESWNELAEGVFSRDVQVAAHDSAVVEIPVEFRYSGIGTALRSLLDSGSFNYRVSGEVAVERPIRTSLPYRHTGTASLTKID